MGELVEGHGGDFGLADGRVKVRVAGFAGQPFGFASGAVRGGGEEGPSREDELGGEYEAVGRNALLVADSLGEGLMENAQDHNGTGKCRLCLNAVSDELLIVGY